VPRSSNYQQVLHAQKIFTQLNRATCTRSPALHKDTIIINDRSAQVRVDNGSEVSIHGTYLITWKGGATINGTRFVNHDNPPFPSTPKGEVKVYPEGWRRSRRHPNASDNVNHNSGILCADLMFAHLSVNHRGQKIRSPVEGSDRWDKVGRGRPQCWRGNS